MSDDAMNEGAADLGPEMEWTEEAWERFTARLAEQMRERYGEGELAAIDDRTLFTYRAGGTERYVSIDDTDEPPKEDAEGAYYEAQVSTSANFEPDRTETFKARL